MRKLKLVEHMSLDSVIQMNNAPGENDFPFSDWSAAYRTPAGLAMLMEKYGERFDLVLGRRTYDQWSGFWPKAPQSPMGDRLNAATKYVVTHRPESLAWGPFEVVGPDFVAGVRRLKSQEGPDLIFAGSCSLTSMVLEHELADELLLLIYPILLGKGKRLFAEGTPPRAFAFESTQTSPTGVLINQYKAAGALQNLK